MYMYYKSYKFENERSVILYELPLKNVYITVAIMNFLKLEKLAMTG